MRVGAFKVQADEELDSESLIIHSGGEPAVRAGFVLLHVMNGPGCTALHLLALEQRQLPGDHSSPELGSELAG